MAVLVALLFLLLVSPAVYAVDHIVGGSSGWGLSGDYTTWAAGETFNAGDNLVFNYDSSHGVVQVTQADYTNCNTGNSLKTFTTSSGSSTIPLTQPGPFYFACPTFSHCASGMKLAINVQAAGGSGGGNTTTTTPSGGSPSSTTPSTTTPDTTKPSSNSAATGSSGSFSILGVSGIIMAALFAFYG